VKNCIKFPRANTNLFNLITFVLYFPLGFFAQVNDMAEQQQTSIMIKPNLSRLLTDLMIFETAHVFLFLGTGVKFSFSGLFNIWCYRDCCQLFFVMSIYRPVAVFL